MTARRLKADATQWGLSASQTLGVTPDFIEIPYERGLKRSKLPRVMRLSHSVCLGDDLEFQERAEILAEDLARLKAIAATVSITSRLQLDPRTLGRLKTLSRVVREHTTIDLFYDFGKSPPPSGVDASQCVVDPMWGEHAELQSKFWKIHGWHPERWVRRYSEEQLRGLMKRAKRHDPRFVILGHSQRAEQLKEIQQWL